MKLIIKDTCILLWGTKKGYMIYIHPLKPGKCNLKLPYENNFTNQICAL